MCAYVCIFWGKGVQGQIQSIVCIGRWVGQSLAFSGRKGLWQHFSLWIRLARGEGDKRGAGNGKVSRCWYWCFS